MKTQKCCQVSRKFSFVSMISLTSTFFLVEIIVGYVTNSMALVADSFHMLSDVVSLLVGYCALRLSAIQQTGSRYTFGWARAEVLGALVNAVFLIALCFSILVEALKRLVMPEHLGDAYLVLITGGIGLFVNIIGLFLFHEHGHGHSHGGHGHSHGGHGHSHGGHGHSHGEHGHDHGGGHRHSHGGGHSQDEDADLQFDDEKEMDDATEADLLSLTEHEDKNEKDTKKKKETKKKKTGKSSSQLNMRAVYLHVLGDALGSVIVVISALLVIYGKGDWTRYVDPSLSIIMVMIILKTSFPLFKESATILMQTVPPHIDLEQIRSRLLKHVPNVRSIHEFHVWQLSGNRIIASVHVRCTSLNEYMKMAEQLKEFFHQEGIHSTTIQPEYVETTLEQHHNGKWKPPLTDPCILDCAKDCSEKQCCRNSREIQEIESSEPSIAGGSQGGSQRSSKNEIESIESGFQTQEDSSQLEVNGSDMSLSQNEEMDLDRRDSGLQTSEHTEKGSRHLVSGSAHPIPEPVLLDVNLTLDVSNSPGCNGSSREIDSIA